MTSPENGFYSAQDADSEGEEGKFYVWSKQEIFNNLGDDTIANIFCEYYGVTQGGNFEGKNILNIRTSLKDLAQRYNRSPEAIERIISDASKRLFELREKRVRPGRDDKILTSWNGLMISGFIKGHQVTNDRKYLEYATNAINFIETRIAKTNNDDDARLQRTFKDGISKLNGYLDDYAFYVNALLDIFEVDSKPEYLEKAIIYTNSMLQHFWDNKDGNLYFTSDDHEQLIVRTKSLYDLAIPSGNSVAASNLLRLYHMTQNDVYLDKAERIMKSGARTAVENPFGFGQLLMAIYLYIKKPIEIIIIKKTEDKQDSHMSRWLNQRFIPNAIIAVINGNLPLQKLQKYSFFKGRVPYSKEDENASMECAFVCRNFTCSLPIYSLPELKRHIFNTLPS
jgi:uncharacterized protein YyaL (SSP411 family)